MQATLSIPIQITPSALSALKRTFLNESATQKIRIGVKGGGCAGLSYLLEKGDETEQDICFEVEQISFIINKAHLLYLEGITLHIGEGLDNRGFEFINPNAKTTCGCGTSFGI